MSNEVSKVLVTGGAGFIGSHLVDRLLNEGFNVSVLDNLSTGELNNLIQHKNNKKFHFIKGDIRNLNHVMKAIQGVEAVFHQAAQVSVVSSIENPILSNEINVLGTINLLNISKKFKVKRFIIASSCAVYGDSDVLPNNEFDKLEPSSPYSVDKIAIENYAKIFQKIYGLETVCLRYFNVYGPRQKFNPYSGVITIFINCLLQKIDPIIYGGGEQNRDFVNVKDIVDANILALNKKNLEGEVFNVGSSKPTSINKLLRIIKKIMKKNSISTIYKKSRKGDIKNSYADITKIEKILGYKPQVNLEDGLIELINSY